MTEAPEELCPSATLSLFDMGNILLSSNLEAYLPKCMTYLNVNLLGSHACGSDTWNCVSIPAAKF